MGYVILIAMLKKGVNIFISVILLLSLLSGTVGLPEMVKGGPPSFQKTCDMDDCNPNMPKCPLCPSSGYTNLYLHDEAGAYVPTPTSSFILLNVSTLSDQGVVKAIFHPPTSIF